MKRLVLVLLGLLLALALAAQYIPPPGIGAIAGLAFDGTNWTFCPTCSIGNGSWKLFAGFLPQQLTLQNLTPDQNTTFQIIPNGTGTNSATVYYNSPDISGQNTGTITVGSHGTYIQMQSDVLGTGVPFNFFKIGERTGSAMTGGCFTYTDVCGQTFFRDGSALFLGTQTAPTFSNASNGWTLSGGGLVQQPTFQTLRANQSTTMNLFPNGTGLGGQFGMYNGSDKTNTNNGEVSLAYALSGTTFLMQSDVTGTGVAVQHQVFGERTGSALADLCIAYTNVCGQTFKRDGSGFFKGTVTAASGLTTIFRCTVAGTLRVGQLTSVAADCGTSVDTGMRTN